MQATEALERFVRSLDAKGKAELDDLLAPELTRLWLPTPGPQLDAYLSEADLLLYGGSAGGGKTDLLIGCAIDAINSVIFRRQFKDLRGVEKRLLEIVGDADFNRGDKVWKPVGKELELAHLGEPGSELSHQGRARDFIGFDEGAQLTAYRVNFVMGWLRSAAGKRCRAVIASNPPIGGEGLWLIEWFAPWLDPLFPNPATPGELRWCIVKGDGDEIKTVWVKGPGRYTVDGKPWKDRAVDGEDYIALSRTYIPARLDDNPYLRETGYRAQINAMPEPLRSQLLHGDFLAGRKDDRWQVIPTEWVKAAQRRWEENKSRPRDPMLHIGVDVAQGGADKTVIACLRGVRFDPLIDAPGKETPDPVPVVQMILGVRRDDAGITIDHGGGYGGGVSSHLKTHNRILTVPFVPSEASGERTRDRSLGFLNRRAEAWWKFREALDPGNPDKDLIELPPDTKLEAELTAPRWTTSGNNIKVESKEDIRDRLKTSTDRADAVIMAWIDRLKSHLRKTAEAHSSDMYRSAPIRDPFEELR
jgi:hypothetical protein